MNSDRWIALAIRQIEAGRVPEWLTRVAIRNMCRRRLKKVSQGGCEPVAEEAERLRQESIAGPIAPVPHKANAQHYEVPATVYEFMLGKHRKYSSCYWDHTTPDLDAAEAKSLELTCQHADLQDGHELLELGCGWGALSLYVAQHYPNCRITGVSNSASQKAYIETRARALGVADRVQILTADMNQFQIDRKFDRVVSIEMFEHMRNYRQLMSRISRWLKPEGHLLVHIFCHRLFCYPFEEEGAENWMGKYFFSGGLMPSDDWLLRFQEDLVLTSQWRWSGTHYQKTAEAWLRNMSLNRQRLLELFPQVYPGESAEVWYRRWRLLYLAGAELFGASGGQEWWVSHYRFSHRAPLTKG